MPDCVIGYISDIGDIGLYGAIDAIVGTIVAIGTIFAIVGTIVAIGSINAICTIGAIVIPNDSFTLSGDREKSIAIEWFQWIHYK